MPAVEVEPPRCRRGTGLEGVGPFDPVGVEDHRRAVLAGQHFGDQFGRHSGSDGFAPRRQARQVASFFIGDAGDITAVGEKARGQRVRLDRGEGDGGDAAAGAAGRNRRTDLPYLGRVADGSGGEQPGRAARWNDPSSAMLTVFGSILESQMTVPWSVAMPTSSKSP